MKTEPYRRPIYASFYYTLAMLVLALTALALLLIVTQFKTLFENPAAYIGLIAFVAVTGGAASAGLWGAGQIFDLLGKIEYNGRRADDDPSVDYLRQIAKNTRPVAVAIQDESDPTFYYYLDEDEVERGPFKRADLRGLIASSHISPYTKVTPEVGGSRLPAMIVADVLK